MVLRARVRTLAMITTRMRSSIEIDRGDDPYRLTATRLARARRVLTRRRQHAELANWQVTAASVRGGPMMIDVNLGGGMMRTIMRSRFIDASAALLLATAAPALAQQPVLLYRPSRSR